MTEANLKFMVEKIKQYGLDRPKRDQLSELITELETERDSINECLFGIAALMQKNPVLTSSQLIGPFIEAAANDLAAKIVDPFLESKRDAAKIAVGDE